MRFSLTICITLIILTCFCWDLRAQCSSLNIDAPSTACIDEHFAVSTSATASSYSWDFCTGDFTQSPTSNLRIQSSVSNPFDLSVSNDSNTWYGFVVGYNSNNLVRINLGADPAASTANETDLGNFGGLLSNPICVTIKKYGGLWYGLVYSLASKSIILLQFGSVLSNTPSAQVIASNVGGAEGSLDFVQTGSNSFVVVLTDNSGTMTILSYLSGLSGGLSNTSTISVGGYLVDVKIIEECNAWRVFVLKFDSKTLARLDFGTSLSNTPSIASYPNNFFSFGPYRFWMGKEGDYLNGLVTNINGGIASLDIGIDATNASPTITDFGNLSGSLTSSWNVFAVKNQGKWIGFAMNGNSSNLFSLTFPQVNCGASQQTSNLKNPGLVSYSAAGNKYPSLTVTYNDGSIDSKTFPITVQSLTANSLQIVSPDSYCVSSSVGFSAQTSSLINPSWSFGDGATSTQSSPSNSYASSGTYTVSLTASGSNGCTNTAQKTIQIFNPPQAAFSLPAASPFCTGQNYVFTNTSTSDTGSNPTWQWNVNGSDVSTSQDLTYQFPSAIAQTVKLTASIPGCSTQSTQTIGSVTQGPLLSFMAPGTSCVNGIVSFNNTSSGAIFGNYNWTFGDGNSSSQPSPTNTYLSNGVFNVTLSASNAAGCQNSFSKTVSVYTNPQPNFSIDLPPFSCAGSATQFNDLTPTLSDSNLSSWSWQFGDTNGGVSQVRNPAYTYATATNYTVSLQVTSNFGCTASTQKVITISPSPQAAFTNTAACINQVTQFTDASTGNIKSRQWKIQGNTLTSTNPTYTFLSSSIFPVTLTVTGNNNCIGQVTQNIVVPVAPVMDFSVLYPCTGTSTQFQETNSGGSDPATAWNWNFTAGSGSGNPTSYSFPSAASYTVTLTSTRQSKCVYSVSKNISIVNGPVAVFTPSTTAGAAPLNVSFTNSSSSATTYAWSFGDANNSSSTVVSPSFVFNELGNYNVRLVASNSFNCTSTANASIKVVVPSVDAYLSSFVLADDQTTSSKRAVVTIVNKGNVPLINPVVKVNLGGNVSIKEAVPETIQAGGSIARTLNMEIIPAQIAYVCALVDVANDIFEGNNEQCVTLSQEEVVLSPYPNPATSEFSIDWITPAAQSVRVMVFRLDGSLMFEQTLDVPAGLTQFKVNSSLWANGLYVVRVAGVQSQKVYKVVIAN
jgi:PKD repeat protein